MNFWQVGTRSWIVDASTGAILLQTNSGRAGSDRICRGLVPVGGVEPPRPCGHRIPQENQPISSGNPERLPFRHTGQNERPNPKRRLGLPESTEVGVFTPHSGKRLECLLRITNVATVAISVKHAPGGIRTPDPLRSKQSLCPLSYGRMLHYYIFTVWRQSPMAWWRTSTSTCDCMPVNSIAAIDGKRQKEEYPSWPPE